MEATLQATKRDQFGKNEAGRIRRAGRIPAVLYGGQTGAGEPLSVDPLDLMKILHSHSGVNTLISLKLDGAGDTRVLVKEYQIDPVFHKLLHADFYRVAMDKVLRATVPIHITGEAKGVKVEGGILDFVHRELEIDCLPANIPEHVTIDVTELMLNQGVRVRDLASQAADKWTAVTDQDMLIVHVIMPRAAAVAEPDAAAAAAAPGAPAEPEVMKKGKTDKPDDEKDKKDKKEDKKK